MLALLHTDDTEQSKNQIKPGVKGTLEVRIELESNDFVEKCLCRLCGKVFIPQEIIARAYRDEGDYITDVCPECIASGSEGISRRIKDQVYHLRILADALEELASGEIETPSFSKYTIVNQIARAFR